MNRKKRIMVVEEIFEVLEANFEMIKYKNKIEYKNGNTKYQYYFDKSLKKQFDEAVRNQMETYRKSYFILEKDVERNIVRLGIESFLMLKEEINNFYFGTKNAMNKEEVKLLIKEFYEMVNHQLEKGEKMKKRNMFEKEFSVEEIEKYKKTNDPNLIPIYFELNEEYIEQNKNNLDMDLILYFQNLSEDFIRRNKNDVNFETVSSRQKLSVQFIYEFINHINFNELSKNRHITIEIIEEFKDKLNFDYLINNIEINDEFIMKYKKRINFRKLYETKNLSYELFVKHLSSAHGEIYALDYYIDNQREEFSEQQKYSIQKQWERIGKLKNLFQ